MEKKIYRIKVVSEKLLEEFPQCTYSYIYYRVWACIKMGKVAKKRIQDPKRGTWFFAIAKEDLPIIRANIKPCKLLYDA